MCSSCRKETHHFVGKLENESSRLKKERRGQDAVVSHLHATWQKRMEYNTIKMNTELSNNTTKLQLKLDRRDENMMAGRVLNEGRSVFQFIAMLF